MLFGARKQLYLKYIGQLNDNFWGITSFINCRKFELVTINEK